MLKIIDSSPAELVRCVDLQIQHRFPGSPSYDAVIERYLPATLERLETCIDAVLFWTPSTFNPLHSSQYCIFLYYLSNTIWKSENDRRICDRLFGLNKAFNGIDLFYEIEMPERFFIGHSVGIVLAKATYGDHLVLYQNSTVGKNNGVAPQIGAKCILYPNSAVIGNCRLGEATTVSQGVGLIDTDTPGNCIAFRGERASPQMKPAKKRYIEQYFRL